MSCDLELERTKSAAYIGTAKVAFANLQFLKYGKGSRLENEQNVQRLIGMFEKARCRRFVQNYHIPGLISEDQLQRALQRSGLNLADLKSVNPPFLQLDVQESLQCLDGQHRAEAARRFFPDVTDHWWPVALYDKEGLPPNIQLQMRYHHDYSENMFDGEIFRNSELSENKAATTAWLASLTASKQRDLGRLKNEYKIFYETLTLLLPFAGLWTVKLFSRRYFRMKCPEEFQNYLKLIHRVYVKILGSLNGELLDPESVHLLEGRSPVWSKVDREFITQQFNNGKLFKHVTDIAIREELAERVLSIEISIPSLYTFLKDIIYLEPAALVLRELLPAGFRGSIYEALKQHFQTGSSDAKDASEFDMAYTRLWLLAIQNFPDLTPIQPLKGDSKEIPSADNPIAVWALVAKAAMELGFDSLQIRKHIHRFPTDKNRNIYQVEPKSDPRISADMAPMAWVRKGYYHCGKPDWVAFNESKPNLTLENIYACPQITQGHNLTAFGVARDIIRAFLGHDKPDTAMGDEPSEQSLANIIFPNGEDDEMDGIGDPCGTQQPTLTQPPQEMILPAAINTDTATYLQPAAPLIFEPQPQTTINPALLTTVSIPASTLSLQVPENMLQLPQGPTQLLKGPTIKQSNGDSPLQLHSDGHTHAIFEYWRDPPAIICFSKEGLENDVATYINNNTCRWYAVYNRKGKLEAIRQEEVGQYLSTRIVVCGNTADDHARLKMDDLDDSDEEL